MWQRSKLPVHLSCSRVLLVFSVLLIGGCVLFLYLRFDINTDTTDHWSEYGLITNTALLYLPTVLTRKDNLCPIVLENQTNMLFADTLINLVRSDTGNFNPSDDQKCREFKQIHENHVKVSDEELEFPLAFSFNVHKEFNQFARLFRAVYRHHNTYCIHVDAKSDLRFRRKVEHLATCFGPNVYVIPLRQSISIRWGDLGTLEAWIRCADFFLKQSVIRWKYMLNGSGQEFPLLTNWELVKALKAINGSNIVESFSTRETERIPKQPLSFNLTWVKGSIYTALRRDMVQFILTNKYAKEILTALRSESHLPKCQDEMFFSTINYNPHFNAPGGCPEVHRPNQSDPRSAFVTRYADWSPMSCMSKRSQRGVCIMGVRNIPKLIRRPEFFVNKFIYDFEPLAFDCLEWWLFRKIRNERDFGHTAINFDPSFYHDLYCSRNHL